MYGAPVDARANSDLEAPVNVHSVQKRSLSEIMALGAFSASSLRIAQGDFLTVFPLVQQLARETMF